MEAYVAIINPMAGGGKNAGRWALARKLFAQGGVKVREIFTDGPGDARMKVREAVSAGARRLISAGGDGTLNETIAGVMDYVASEPSVKASDFYVAVVPAGSGNDWIKSHGVPPDVEGAVKLILSDSYAPQDVVKVSQTDRTMWMINVAGAGFDADICRRVNVQKSEGKTGKLIYLKALAWLLRNSHSDDVEVLADGQEVFSGKLFSASFGTGKYSGGGMRQTPHADPSDGLTDVTIIPTSVFPKVFLHVWKLYSPYFQGVPNVIPLRCRSVELRSLSGADVSFEVDGEDSGSLPVRLDIWPDKVNVLHGYR